MKGMLMQILRRKISILLCVILAATGTLFLGNKAYAAEPVSVEIPVRMTGKNTEEAFHCRIHSEETAHLQIETDELTLKNGESGTFKVTVDYPGNYSCTISQEKGTDSDTKYDDTLYQVGIYVTEDDSGSMKAEPYLYKDGSDEKEAEASFQNSKTIPKKPSENPTTNPATNPVRTGDKTPLAGWLILLCGSVCMVIGLASKKKWSR